MVKLKFNVAGKDVECEGTVEEIERILFILSGRKQKPEVDSEKEEIDLKEKIPTQETLINYIVSKPDFEHNIFEIEEHFFGRRFHSHGADAKKYNALYRRLGRVREKIEIEYSGSFVGEWAQTPEGEPYKIFKFIKEKSKE